MQQTYTVIKVYIYTCIVASHRQRFSTGILIIFFVRNCVKCEEMWSNVWLPCTVNVQHSDISTITSDLHLHKMSKIHSKTLFTVISPTICFIWKATFDAVLCICMWIVHVRLCSVGLQWHKMHRKCLDHASSWLLTTVAHRNRVSTGWCFFGHLNRSTAAGEGSPAALINCCMWGVPFTI